MTDAESSPSEIEVFFDGGCPLCVREISLIRHWDRHRERIKFIDIHDPAFSAEDYGKTHADFMAKMHARLSDGTWITGVEVFRRMYAAVGFGSLVWMSRWPGISQMMDLGYTIFARNRLWITGRCASGTCGIHRTHGKN